MSEENSVKSAPDETQGTIANTLAGEGQQQQRGRSGRGNRDRGRGQQARGGQNPRVEASLNLGELRELAELVEQYGFTDFEFENQNIRVRLRKEVAAQIVSAPTGGFQTIQNQVPAASSVVTGTTVTQPAASGSGVAELPTAEDELHQITSPIVGTFYRSPSPEAESFVKIGSRVTSETIVCIVEAMKLMNEIQAETTGEIVKIYVENGQPVEYGQPLFGIKK